MYNHVKGGRITMKIGEYIETRLDDQIDWYDKKANKAQKHYKRFQIVEIILAACIPLLAGYASIKFIAIIVGLFGSVIAVIEAIVKLNKYHENWIDYRATCEMLRYHKYLYITNSGPYNESEETKENLFIRTIETIISSENNQWKVNQKEKKKTN